MLRPKEKQLEVGIDWISAVFKKSKAFVISGQVLNLERYLFTKKPAKKLHKTNTVVYEFWENIQRIRLIT